MCIHESTICDWEFDQINMFSTAGDRGSVHHILLTFAVLFRCCFDNETHLLFSCLLQHVNAYYYVVLACLTWLWCITVLLTVFIVILDLRQVIYLLYNKFVVVGLLPILPLLMIHYYCLLCWDFPDSWTVQLFVASDFPRIKKIFGSWYNNLDSGV